MAITQRGRAACRGARAARADRGRDRSARGAAERHPRGGRQGVRARPRRRAADVAPARRRQRLPARTSRGRRCRSRTCSRTRPSATATTSASRRPASPSRDRHAAPDRRGGARACSSAARCPAAELRAAYRDGDRRARRGAPLLPHARRRGRERGRADRAQGRDLDEGRADDRRARRSSRATCRSSTRRSRRAARPPACQLLGKTNTDEFAMGSSTENSAYGPTQQPVGSRARARRLRRRLGGGRVARAWRRGRSAPTPAGRSSSPPRCAGTSACARRTAPCRATGSSRFASSLDQVGPVTKTVRDNALLYGIISGRDECDSTTVDVPPVELPRRRGPEGPPCRRPEGAERGGGNRARASPTAVRRAIDLCGRARRGGGRVRAAALRRVRPGRATT